MSLVDVSRLVHVLSAFWFVTGIVARDIVLAQARSATDIGRVQTLVAASKPFGRLMVVPGSMAVFFLGLLTWWAEHLPLWGSGSRWVTVSLVLFGTTIPLVPLVFLKRGKVAFGQVFGSAVREGRITPELTAALNDRAVAAARRYEKAVVAVVIVLMVTKPF